MRSGDVGGADMAHKATRSVYFPPMPDRLRLAILPQPDGTTCGPTCLHAVYGFHGLELPLERVIKDVKKFDEGGTYAVLLGADALRRGFDVEVYTWNLQVFDPTWFRLAKADMRDRLAMRRRLKTQHKLLSAIDAYLEFMDAGGEVRFED